MRNTTPQGGSQAEAVILNGTTTARASLKELDLYSYQDTLQINGQAYVSNCRIEGDVDFLWGTGPAFFDRCVLRSLRSGAYYTQVRNPATNHGYVFHRCAFEGLPGIMGNFLSRVQPGRFPYSEVVLIRCLLGNAVGPVAWQFQETSGIPVPSTDNVHFWEFDSRAPEGRPVDRNFRMPGSRELRQPGDDALIADYSRPAFVLGSGWDPLSTRLFAAEQAMPAAASRIGLPVITTQPASQMALLGTHSHFTVAVAGPGPLAYQWSKNGAAIPGANSPVLQLNAVGWADAAVYAVTVSNRRGSVESQAVRLTTVAPAAALPPQLPSIPVTRFEATAYGAVGDDTTDNTAAIQKTIDAAVAAGGGIVVLPAAAAPYLSGPLILGSGLNLQVEAGAILQALPYAATPRPGGYPLGGKDYAHFITANNAHDVALTGGGRIEGQGQAWWKAFEDDKNMPHRPYLVRLGNCQRVLVSGLTFTNSPMFHVGLSGIDHLTVFGITVESEEGPNTDGLDPSGTHHLIQNCVISCGDDNIAMKPGSVYCSDITISDCAFGTGHGLSVGGQTNSGLDGMTVRNCTFDGTTSGLRLKADPTQGGPVQNISYSNLVMRNVRYPIVFYSYYNKVGNPGSPSGSLKTTPDKVRGWNAAPPNSLTSRTLPSWKNISISNLVSWGSGGYGILWGLALEGYFIDNVRLNNVQMSGGPGFEIFNATNVQFSGGSDLGTLVSANALAITAQPQGQSAAPGTRVEFSIAAVAPGSATFQWSLNGVPLADGTRPDGSVIAGAATARLTIDKVHVADAGKYACAVTARLDAFDLSSGVLVPGKTVVSAASDAAVLAVAIPNP